MTTLFDMIDELQKPYKEFLSQEEQDPIEAGLIMEFTRKLEELKQALPQEKAKWQAECVKKLEEKRAIQQHMATLTPEHDGYIESISWKSFWECLESNTEEAISIVNGENKK